MKKIGTQKTFEVEHGKIIFGTVDKNKCESFYIRLETWITPTHSLSESIDKIRRVFKSKINSIGHICLEDQYLNSIIDINHNQTKSQDVAGKKSFIGIEITLFAVNSFDYDNDFVFIAKNIGNTYFDLLLSMESDFCISPTKK